MFLLALHGCIEFGLDPVEDDAPDRAVVVEEFRQRPRPSVDVLFVVDRTPSMGAELGALGAGFPALADALDLAGVGWQVGVVSADAGEAGWLRGSPYVITPELPDFSGAFARAVGGADAAGPEAGLAMAASALAATGPGGANAGFRRAGAALAVVFVSDADDRSDGMLGDDPVAAFLEALDAEGSPAIASAIVGDLPSGCSSGQGDARPGFRYHEVAVATGGIAASICSGDLADALADLGGGSVVWETSFALRAAPVEGTVRVEVDGIRVTGGWTLDATVPAVVFDVPPSADARIVVRYLVEVGG